MLFVASCVIVPPDWLAHLVGYQTARGRPGFQSNSQGLTITVLPLLENLKAFYLC